VAILGASSVVPPVHTSGAFAAAPALRTRLVETSENSARLIGSSRPPASIAARVRLSRKRQARGSMPSSRLTRSRRSATSWLSRAGSIAELRRLIEKNDLAERPDHIAIEAHAGNIGLVVPNLLGYP